MTDNSLEVSPAKSEAIVLTRKWAYRKPEVHIIGVPIPVNPTMRYLGVQLDTRRTYT